MAIPLFCSICYSIIFVNFVYCWSPFSIFWPFITFTWNSYPLFLFGEGGVNLCMHYYVSSFLQMHRIWSSNWVVLNSGIIFSKAIFGFQIIAIELNGFLAWQAPHFSFPLADDAQLTPLLRLGAGACAGIIAMSATYPMDMVRGRLTVQVLWSIRTLCEHVKPPSHRTIDDLRFSIWILADRQVSSPV